MEEIEGSVAKVDGWEIAKPSSPVMPDTDTLVLETRGMDTSPGVTTETPCYLFMKIWQAAESLRVKATSEDGSLLLIEVKASR